MLIALAFCLLVGLAAPAAGPPPIDGGGVRGLDLKTQLEKGLRARRDVEFAYIDAIVKLVAEEKLPRKLVTTTYQWAQRKPVRRLQYFQFALQARAKGLHVKLPNLRDQAVGLSNGSIDRGSNQ
jgi:hypothetical protein